MILQCKDPAIECVDLGKTFRNRSVLHNINCSIPSGNVTAFVGSNGAGKTTLLRILATLLLPSTGTVRILGMDSVRDQRRIKSLIGYVSSEERSLYWRLTGRQNLVFFSELYGVKRSECNNRIDGLLESVGFREVADIRVCECSSGMRQILGLMRGMVHNPPLLLLDEPTRSLSPDAATRVRRLLRRVAERDRRTVLIASHNLTEVESIADIVFILHRGIIQAAGTLEMLRLEAGMSEGGNLDLIFKHFMERETAAV